jgi:D-3-phosphoglycerate dehydrogenase
MASSPATHPRVILVDAIQDYGTDYSIERQALSALGVHLDIAACRTEAEIIAAAGGYDVVATIGLRTPLTAHVIQNLPACRLIARYAVGYDNIDVAAASQAGIIVANAPAFCTDEVADHTVALVFALVRKVLWLDRFVREANWRESWRSTGPVRRLSALTLGLVGFGGIGRRVAQHMGQIVGAILACDPFAAPEVAEQFGVTLTQLDDLLAAADIVSLHVPLVPATHQMIAWPHLARMKPTAFFINTSRGAVVDEAALIQALRQGCIAGAALDVFEAEPLPADSPLREMPNVILTPHFGWYSNDAVRQLSASVTDSICDLLQGYWPRHVVNPEVQPRLPLQPRPKQ